MAHARDPPGLMKGVTMNKYKWHPPTWTEEERKRSIEARAERVRKAAEGWDMNGEWQRAMGVEPRARKAR